MGAFGREGGAGEFDPGLAKGLQRGDAAGGIQKDGGEGAAGFEELARVHEAEERRPGRRADGGHGGGAFEVRAGDVGGGSAAVAVGAGDPPAVGVDHR